MTDKQLEQAWLERNRLANVAAVDGEDAATQQEWEHMARIRAECLQQGAVPPSAPDDKL